MSKLYEMKDMLMAEIDKIAEKGNINMTDLETLNKLTGTVKNINMIEGGEERGTSIGYGPQYSYGEDYGRYSGTRYSGDAMRRGGDGRSGAYYPRGGRDYYM